MLAVGSVPLIGVVILVVLFARGPVVRDWPVLRRHLPYLLIMGTVGFTAFNTLSSPPTAPRR